MAEGWLRHLKGDQFKACSAGIVAHGLNPNAVSVMAEAGVDISQQTSKTLDSIKLDTIDTVITVCGNADETCPVLPSSVSKIHVGFDDPPKLAEHAQSAQEALQHYRRVRDEIRTFIETIEQVLNDSVNSDLNKASGNDVAES